MFQKLLFLAGVCCCLISVILCIESVEEIDIECSDVRHVRYIDREYRHHHYNKSAIKCYSIFTSLDVNSPTTKVRMVVNDISNSWRLPLVLQVDTSNIDILHIEQATQVKFMPAGIKLKFPKLSAFIIGGSELAHLEQNDMKQFGDDLMYADFEFNELTALEGDLFDFNPNLKYASFAFNPLKYIDQSFFGKLKALHNLQSIDTFINTEDCVEKMVTTTAENNLSESSEYDGEKDDENKVICYDESTRQKNMNIIDKRATFFVAFDKDVVITEKNRKIEMMEKQIDELQRKIESLLMQLTSPHTRMQNTYGESSTERITTAHTVGLNENIRASEEPFIVEENTTELLTKTSTEESNFFHFSK